MIWSTLTGNSKAAQSSKSLNKYLILIMTSKTNFNQNWTTDTNGKMVHVDKPRKLLGKQLEN